jgi:predicted ATPase/class 3 adenylate cyclase
MTDLPSGTVTFLFTDIEGSTRRWEEHPAAMRAAVDRHFVLLRETIGAHGGHVFRNQGDGLCAAFAMAQQALEAALAAQLALHREQWLEGDALRVRMALHTGSAEVQDGDYVGACLNRMGRLQNIGYGGQTLLSRTTYELVREALPAGTGLRDLGEHRLRDLDTPEQIFQLLHPELPTEFPPLKSLDPPHHNLPIQLTSFVGRERELAAVQQLLLGERLVTLTGAGGVGKTRLALRLAADRLDSIADGVWLVDLAPLADANLVPQAVAAALGVREQPERPLVQTLADALRDRHLLLLLDNCEHLVAACAALADSLLRACPWLRVLATSREPLGITGEAIWRVPPLASPEPDRLPSLESLVQYEAVRLLLDRAELAAPSFAITEQNAAAVAQVCQQLDGLPLALELAAARVKVLSMEQLAARLSDRFRLLTGGSRSALPRQQTLRALVDWSYDLLTEPEQVLFRRLAVFAGGCTLEAAEAVCAGDGVQPGEVLEHLARLVDKSLVIAEPSPGSQVRYRLPETIRQYSAEKLGEAGEGATLRGRHRDWCLALAERTGPGVLDPQRLAWLEREYDNLRAALRSSIDSGQAEPGLRLAAGLCDFWYARGYSSEGCAWLAELLALPATTTAAMACARALEWAGRLAYLQGDELDRQRIAKSLVALGHGALRRGDALRARLLFNESLGLARDAGDHLAIALCLEGLASVAVKAQPERAVRLAGAAEAVRNQLRARLPDTDREQMGRWLAAARRALGGGGYAAALAEGRAMTVGQALAYALAEGSQSAPVAGPSGRA